MKNSIVIISLFDKDILLNILVSKVLYIYNLNLGVRLIYRFSRELIFLGNDDGGSKFSV